MLERPLRSVPKPVLLLLLVGLSLQVTWYHSHSSKTLAIHTLEPPPKFELMRVLSFGEPIASAKMWMLWLQSFYMQSGRFVYYRDINYTVLIQWLETILQLDPKSQYPLFTATRVYSIVPNSLKRRQMWDFVYQKFLTDPSLYWQWLAEATVLAHHKYKELPLALKYSQALTTYTPLEAPDWTRRIQIFVLAEMGKLEQAQLVAQNLLSDKRITDPKEKKLLKRFLKDLQRKQSIQP